MADKIPFYKKMIILILGKMQAIFFYRKLAALLRPDFIFVSPDEEEFKKILAWMNPGGRTPSMDKHPNIINVAAKRKNRIIGFIQLLRNPDDAPLYPGFWIFSLSVKPFYRGMNIGTMLSKEIINIALNKGAKEIFLRVRMNNKKAIALYHKLGFAKKKIPAFDEAQLEKERLNPEQRWIIMSKLLPGNA